MSVTWRYHNAASLIEALKNRVYGEEGSSRRTMLRDSFHRLEAQLDQELEQLKIGAAASSSGQVSVIPEVQFGDIVANDGQLPVSVREAVAKRGILIVRSVFSSNEAKGYLESIQAYMTSNGMDPTDPMQFWPPVNWSRAQVSTTQVTNDVVVLYSSLWLKHKYL